MSIQRNPENVITTLIQRLAKAKGRASELESSSNTQIQLNEQLEKIEKELKDMMDIFPRVKNWEDLVMKELDAIEQNAGDDIYEDCEQVKDIEEKFQSMKERIAQINKLNSPIQLQSIIFNTPILPQPQQSMSEAWKMSEHWLRLEMEKNILEHDIMANFEVSYDILELQLKLCLLCFSIFPENSVIKKRPLIYWWIGEGLITHIKNKTAEEIGEGVVEELVEKGMIEPVDKNRSPMVSSYTMHPWIRRMVISVARKAGFFNFDDSGKPIADFHVSSRRACLVSTNDCNFRQEELLTLFNVTKNNLHFELESFLKLRKLLVLQLGRWQNSPTHHIEVDSAEFLNGLQAQKHLKYLSLRGISRITKLPYSISKLTNLKILDLRACHNLEKLPSGIKAMKKLTHLDVSECYLLEHMPKGLESLSELQVLKGFVVGNSRSKDPCRLKELAKLKKLRKLSIIVGSEAIVSKEELGELRQSETLRILTITWGAEVHSTPHEVVKKGAVQSTAQEVAKLERAATMTMSSLSMPQNLEKLDLRCFPKNVSPNWLSPSELKNLERLYIRGGKLSRLRYEIDTWNVKVLRLKFMKDLEMEWSGLLKAFPRLVYLEKIKCDKLDSFLCDEHGVWVNDKEVSENINTP